jgi:hypothetical protein
MGNLETLLQSSIAHNSENPCVRAAVARATTHQWRALPCKQAMAEWNEWMHAKDSPCAVRVGDAAADGNRGAACVRRPGYNWKGANHTQ